MSDTNNFLEHLASKTQGAATEARAQTQLAAHKSPFVRGKVSVVNGDGTGDVILLSSGTGNNAATLHHVPAFPPESELSVDQLVMVYIPNEYEPPIIWIGGGDSCASGLTDFGVLID